MSDLSAADRMRADWNERAREDAHYYVAFGRREQSLADFLATAADVLHGLEAELKRFPPGDKRQRRALEIGCGPGRLMMPMSWNFGEVHGVDVSDEMIRLALRNLSGVTNAFPRLSNGADLAAYGDGLFDFVYSYAVFQHIPSREIVWSNLAEARRVLGEDGILRCQVNGLPKTAKEYTTWAGVRIDAGELAEFAAEHDLQLLAIEGTGTQYMWSTMRKREHGWYAALCETRPKAEGVRLRGINNSHSGEPAVPASGRFASISLWVENLPADCDLNTVSVVVDGLEAAPVYIGPQAADGLTQVNALLPKNLRTGLVPVELHWFGEPLCEEAWMRVIPPGPRVPRVFSFSDGVNLVSGPVITSRSVKVYLEEVPQLEGLAATVDGAPVEDLDTFCIDPLHERWEVNFTLPKSAGPGAHQIEILLGARRLPNLAVEVAA